MDVVSMIFYFLIVFAVLVNIHEFGHFIAARISGMRVDIFSFGMGNRLFGWNKKYGFTFGKIPDDFEQEGVCDYRVSLFPIGGYVKIAGMIDESMDTEFLKSEPKPWEFRSKNAFLKAFTISAGVIMNALLAVLFFAIIIFSQGRSFKDTTTVVSIDKNSINDAVGLAVGDKVLSVNGREMHYWEEVIKSLTTDDLGSNKTVKVIRNGETIDLTTDGSQTVKMIADSKFYGINPEGCAVVFEQVETLRPAGRTGLTAGDTVLSINSTKVFSPPQVKEIVSANKETKIPIEWKRGGEIFKDSVTPDADGLIGVAIAQVYTGPVTVKQYGIGESIIFGFEETWNSVDLFVSSMAQIFKGNVAAKQALGGPIMIAKQASRQAEMGVVAFMNFMALLSITLAFINILPFPALDGGHLLFIIIEAIIRREIPTKAKMIIQQTGFFLLLALMVYVVYLDIIR